MKTRIARYSNPLIAIILALSSTSCAVVGPDYKQPDIAVPTQYKEADQTIKEGQAIAGDWWLVYRDDKLDQLIATATLHNHSLQAAAARMRQAQSLAAIAQADRVPNIYIGGRNDFGILAAWEADLWGRVHRNIEANDAAAEASVADLAAAKLSLQAQLAQNYFMLRVKDAEIRLLLDTVTSYQRSLEITSNQYAVGVASQGDVAQAQAQLSTARSLWSSALIERSQFEHALAVLVGEAPADFNIEATSLNITIPDIPALLPSTLLRRRPDIVAAERRMAVANAQVGVAEAETWPRINLSIGVSVVRKAIGGSDISAPLYTNGKLRQNRDKSMARYDEVVADYRQAVLNSFREVEDELIAMRILDQALQAQTNAEVANGKVVQIMKNQYKAGVAGYQSIIIAEAEALSSRRSKLGLLERRLVASVALIKALGGGWQPEADSSEN